jgi:hypothetical protein
VLPIHIIFKKAHGVDNSLRTGLADIELGCSSSSMAKDAIIMSRSVTEEQGIRGDAFIPSVHLAHRETGLEMFP